MEIGCFGVKENFEVGDVCLIDHGWSNYTKVTVAKLTKTQVVLSDGSKFNQRGNLVGGETWSRASLTKDPAKFADYYKRKNASDLSRAMEKIQKMPPELVEAILKFVDEHPLFQPLKDVR